METLKFLMISTHFPPYQMGGDAIFVEYLTKELLRKGHQVDVFYNPAAYRYLRKGSQVLPVEKSVEQLRRYEHIQNTKSLGLVLNLTFGFSSSAEKELRSIIRERKPDVIHWHNTKGFLGKPISVPGVANVYTAHDYYSVCPRSNLVRPGNVVCRDPRWCQICLLRWHKPPQLWRIGGHRVLPIGKDVKVLCPSEFMAERLKADGIHVHRVLRGFVPDPGMNLRHRNAHTEYIIFVGILENRKGPLTLLKSFGRSAEKHGFDLYVVGEGPLKEDIKNRASELGIGKRVHVTGFLPRDKLNDLLANASAMVVPSEWPENAPSTALEAFSLGVPVIGTRIGGLAEMLAPDTGSILYESGSYTELSEVLVSIWNDMDNLKKRGVMARGVYETRFSPEIHVSEYLRTIRER